MNGCRSCGRDGLVTVLDYGETPLANALLTEDDLDRPEPTYPLVLAFCPGCTLVQITETVPPETLFRDYPYFSSFADTTVAHAHDLAARLVGERGLDGASLVVEIASNDGYLLRHYAERGVPVLGVEPAQNVAEAAGVPTLTEFFSEPLARTLRAEGTRASVLHAHNVLAHVADLNGVVAGIAHLLASDGIVVVEVPYVRDLVDRGEFDTVYHEHLCYFSLTALDALFRRHRLAVTDVERIPIHGGSLRLFAAHGGGRSEAVRALLAEEEAWGVASPERYGELADRAGRLRAELVVTLRELKAEGRRLAAYGASAKGSTLLNYCGIGADVLDFVVDRSTVKQGRYTPGTHLPIHAPEHLLEAMPDDVLLLTWNFADEILEQQAAYRARGGRFILPVPEVTLV